MGCKEKEEMMEMGKPGKLYAKELRKKQKRRLSWEPGNMVLGRSGGPFWSGASAESGTWHAGLIRGH